jgi:hypothetical protein
MKRYALILACLAWASSSLYAQGAGGSGGSGGSGGGGGGGGSGAIGGAGGGAGTGAIGGAGGTGAGTGIGGAPSTAPATPPISPGLPTATPGVPPVTPGAPPITPRAPSTVVPAPGTAPNTTPGIGAGRPRIANPGTAGTPGQTAPNVTPLPGETTGAIGGVGPGIGGIGGTPPGARIDPMETPGVQPNAGIPQTGVTGNRGPATPGGAGAIGGTPAGLQRGVTTQPGVGIGETGTGTPADIALSQRVRAQLLNSGQGINPTTRPNRPLFTPQSLSSVEINANNGLVTLNGSVRSQAERSLVEAQIRQVEGVRSVVNNLVVNPAARGTAGALGTSSGTDGARTTTAPRQNAPRQPRR